jgi:hypothetical protein
MGEYEETIGEEEDALVILLPRLSLLPRSRWKGLLRMRPFCVSAFIAAGGLAWFIVGLEITLSGRERSWFDEKDWLRRSR